MNFGLYKLNGSIAQNVGYSSYVANLSQSGTSAPTITFESNGLSGAVAFQYVGAGSYRATSTGLFTNNKTTVIIAQNDETAIFAVLYVNTNQINITTADSATQTPANGYLNKTFFEIRVYP